MTSTLPFDILTDSTFETVLDSEHNLTLVFVASNWSGNCHLVSPILKKLKLKFQTHITVYKMDYDSNKRTVSTYGIHDLPTILFFQNGQLIDQVTGTTSENELISRIQLLL